ncbi:MAG: ArdC-like ssDNA-binding domain-containing protein [Planctomycetaceae bacterium]
MKKEDAKQLADQAITALQEELKAGCSESLLRYLDSMSRFHSYSFTNSLLIMLQNPEATLVAGFQRWLRMGRHVRQGEKGIGIMAPLVYRSRSDSSDQHSGPSPETRSKSERTVRGFKMVHVFDVSQTEGEDLPDTARIEGDPGHLLGSLEELIRSNGIELRYEALPIGTKGVSRKGEIGIALNLDAAERFAVLAHELAHEWMHDVDQRQNLPKTVRETEAEAVAYVVCRSFGLDCSTRSSDYIQMYRGDEATLIASLVRIQRTSARMIHSLSEATTGETDEPLEAMAID